MKKAILTIAMFLSMGAYAENIELTANNSVSLRTEVNAESVNKVKKQLAGLVELRGNTDTPIYLVLDTPGGSIIDGLLLIEFTKSIKNLQTVTIFAASMGSAIVQSIPGTRNILGTGILMFHRAAGGFDGQFEDGELESRLDFFKRLVRDMEQVNADRMSIPLADYKKKAKDELWIYGKDSIKQKAADKIVSVSCDKKLIDSRESFDVEFMFTTLTLEQSSCPLINDLSVVAPAGGSSSKEFLNDMKDKYLESKSKLKGIK